MCDENTTINIGPTGGNLVLKNPDSPIYGSKITFPSGSVDQETTFSITHDDSHDSDILMAEPVLIQHNNVQLKKNIQITLPLRNVPTENMTLMIMLFDIESNSYMPSGLLIDISEGATEVNFPFFHLSNISSQNTTDTLKTFNNEKSINVTVLPLYTRVSVAGAINVISAFNNDTRKVIYSSLAELVFKVEESIKANTTQILEDYFASWDALSESCEDKLTCKIITEIFLSGQFPSICNEERISSCVDYLSEKSSKMLELLLFRGISICDDIGEYRRACFPISSMPITTITCPLVTVSNTSEDKCMGRCGSECPGDTDPDPFERLVNCGNSSRYTQACLNHDACVRYHENIIHPNCDLIFPFCVDDCLSAPICQNENNQCVDISGTWTASVKILEESCDSYKLNNNSGTSTIVQNGCNVNFGKIQCTINGYKMTCSSNYIDGKYELNIPESTLDISNDGTTIDGILNIYVTGDNKSCYLSAQLSFNKL